MTDYSDALFQATDILFKSMIDKVSIAKTYEGSIVDIARAKEGRYKVSYNNLTVDATCDHYEYKINDAVYVTYFDGDTTKIPIITGKIPTDAGLYSGNKASDFALITTENLFKQFDGQSIGLIANSGENTLTINPRVPHWTWTIGANEDASKYTGFTHMYVAITAATAFGDNKPIQGNYGISLRIYYDNNEPNNDQLDTFDMFGDVYNFVLSSTQDKLIKIKIRSLLIKQRFIVSKMITLKINREI